MSTQDNAPHPFAGTPGFRYVAEFLPTETPHRSNLWIIEAINDGDILLCPHCKFVRLPRFPFPPDTQQGGPHVTFTEDDCDICLHLPAARSDAEGVWDAAFADPARAPFDVSEQRAQRAELLFLLFVGGLCGADALAWAERRAALEGTLRRGSLPRLRKLRKARPRRE